MSLMVKQILQPTTRLLFHKNADRIFRIVMIIFASIALLLMASLFCELLSNSFPSIKKFGLGFLISQEWDPVKSNFGALSCIYGTVVSTLIALLIAIPLSLGISIFLVEIAPPSVSRWVGGGIELLAAVPSIIFGMWGLFVFAPFMANSIQPLLAKYLGFLPLFQGPKMGIGMLTAGIILAFMILPYMTAIIRDVFQLVPPVLKESAYGIGATTWEVTRNVTIPYGLNGIVGACFIGLGRALGETMAVTFVIGNRHMIDLSLFAAGNSIASTLANEFSEASDPMYLSSLIELGLILLIMTFFVQIFSQSWLNRIKRNLEGSKK